MILKLSNLICLLFIMLFISICFYVVPSSDDYCYSAGALENGFLGNIWWNYIHWSGRLSSTALVQIPLYLHKIFPLSFIEAYKIYCIIIILVCSAGVFIIFHISDFSDRNFDNIFPFLLTFATAIAIAVSPSDLFFWVPGSVTYMIPGVLYLCIISGLSNIVFTQKRFSSTHVCAFCGLCLLASMSNEFTGPSLFLMAGTSLLFLACNGRMERHRIISILLYGGVSLVGSLIVAMAPGNNVRVETHTRLDYLEIVIKSFYHLRNYISNDFLGLDLILYIFALILFFSIFHKSRSRDFHSPYRLAAFHVLAWLIIVGLAFIAAVYGTGKDLPGRAQNQLQIVGLGSTAVMVGAIVLANKVAIRNFMEEKLRGAYDFRGVVFFLTLVALLINPVFLSAAIGFANGRVQSVYEQEVDRVNRILVGPDDVRVPPIIERSKLNSPRDIAAPDQSGYWVNECMAMFFGKRSIVPDLAQEPSD